LQTDCAHAEAPLRRFARAKYAAPISTTSKCTETISNGNRYGRPHDRRLAGGAFDMRRSTGTPRNPSPITAL